MTAVKFDQSFRFMPKIMSRKVFLLESIKLNAIKTFCFQLGALKSTKNWGNGPLNKI